MGKINKFEDLEIWKLAREICKDIHQFHESTKLKSDFKLYNQINGSSGSVMDYIAEGFERNGNKEFCQFLSILLPKLVAGKPGRSFIESWIEII